MSRHRSLLLCVALIASHSAPLAAQSLRATDAPATGLAREPRRATALRSDRAPVIDGKLDDVAWRDVAVLGDFIQQSPDENQPITQRTEVRVLMDDGALYVAMRLFDSAPDSIVGPLARRDYTGYSDWAHVLIDSYHDRRTAFHFAVNPSGVKRDGYISGDSEWQEDPGWDAVWDVATRRDSAGWTAEFRIPLSQLRFSAKRGANDWGIEFIRDLARRNERTMWAPIARSGSRFVSLFGTLDRVRTDAAPRRMEMTPYTVARHSSNAEPGNPFKGQRESAVTVGADFNVGVTSNLTLTGTVNPDFGQVEADPSEVNLTGAETFFRERRPFFVEGSDIFQYGLSLGDWIFGGEQLFYSRRIGRAPQGTLPSAAAFTSSPTSTSLLGAAKLTGLVSGWRVGALSVTTPETRGQYMMANGVMGSAVVEPLSHYGVLRISHDFDDGNSTLGAIATATNRRLADSSTATMHDAAYAGGLEGRWRFGAGRSLGLSGYVIGSTVTGSRASLLETQTNTTHLFQRPDEQHVDSSATSMGGLASEIRFEKTGAMPFAGITAHVVTPGFDVNDLGFQTSSGYKSSVGWFGWDLFTPTRLTRQRSAWFNAWSMWGDHGDRRVTGGSLWSQVVLHNFWQITSVTGYTLPGSSALLLRGGPAVRTPSSLDYNLRLNSDPRRSVVGGFTATGRRALTDAGSSITLSPIATVRPSGRLELELQPSIAWKRDPQQYVDAPENLNGAHFLVGDLRQRTASLTARMNFAFTTALTFQGYAQPFVSAGRYAAIGEVVNPMAVRWSDRVRSFDETQRAKSADGERLVLTSPSGPLTIDNPDFNVGDFNANLVLRWEYRPGSALFVVWNQHRSVDGHDGTGAVADLSHELWQAPSSTVLLVKWSHYFGR